MSCLLSYGKPGIRIFNPNKNFVMKTLFILLLTAQHLFCYCQDDSAVIKRIFKASITQIKSRSATGYLAAVDDSTISLADKAPSRGIYAKEGTNLVKFHYNGIEKVVIRRKGATGRGLLYGAIIGLASGAIWGLSSGNDRPGIISFTAGQKAIIGGFTCAIVGTGIGGVIGSVVRKRFKIGGGKERFDEMHSSMFDRVYGSKQQ